MLLRGHLRVLFGACAIAGCAASAPVRSGDPLAMGPVDTSVATEAEGVKLTLPKGAKGPLYDSDDYHHARPTWESPGWHVHFVYGNGGLTQFMEGARCLSLDDKVMRRRVCIGNYMYYGAMADISRVATPEQVSSMQVTIEPNGLTEAQALAIVRSTSTSWEVR
jgi:hypothetical protein